MPAVASLPVGVNAGREAVSGGGFSLTEARYHAPGAERRHSHRHDLLAFALRGGATLGGLGARPTTCSALGLSIVPGGVEHTHTVSSGCRCLILECGPASLSDEVRGSLFERPRVLETGVAAAFGLALHREFRHSDDLSALSIEGLLLRLTGDLGAAPDAEPRRPPWLLRVRDRLHAEFRGRIRIAHLAAEASVHPVYLVRAFRRQFGIPPAAYVRGLRLAAAAKLLVSSRARLSEVASRSGFADQSQLTRHFSQVAGQSPGAFRAACGQEGSSITASGGG